MAVILENLIDLSLLTNYDENIKKWIVNRINNTVSNTNFTTSDNLPVEGKEGVLYITESSIKRWNGVRYVDIGNPPEVSESTTWSTF